MGVKTDNSGVQGPNGGLRETGHGADQSDAVTTVDSSHFQFCLARRSTDAGQPSMHGT